MPYDGQDNPAFANNETSNKNLDPVKHEDIQIENSGPFRQDSSASSSLLSSVSQNESTLSEIAAHKNVTNNNDNNLDAKEHEKFELKLEDEPFSSVKISDDKAKKGKDGSASKKVAIKDEGKDVTIFQLV